MGCVYSEILNISFNVEYQTTACIFLHNLVAFIQGQCTARLNSRVLEAWGIKTKSHKFQLKLIYLVRVLISKNCVVVWLHPVNVWSVYCPRDVQ